MMKNEEMINVVIVFNPHYPNNEEIEYIMRTKDDKYSYKQVNGLLREKTPFIWYKTPVKKAYKLRFYYKTGAKKGDLSHEEFFEDKESALIRYNEVFRYSDFSLNPTLWYLKSAKNKWERIQGF